MPEPNAAPELHPWTDVQITDLESGFIASNFASISETDTFSVVLARQMLSVAKYGSTAMTAEFEDHPAIFNHPCRVSAPNNVERTFSHPVIRHAYSLENIQVVCSMVRKSVSYARLKEFSGEDTQKTVSRLRLLVGTDLRSKFTDELIGRAEVSLPIELFRANRRGLGSVAVQRQPGPILFHDIP